MGIWDEYQKYSGLDVLKSASPFGSMFNNPADDAMKFYERIPGETHKNLDPWVKYGQQLTQHPGERLNEIGQGYHQSPGFQFALQQALQGAGHGAAAGGMAGSPQHEQQNMQLATNLANQDYNQWMQNALGLHNIGYGQGQAGATSINDQIAQALAQQGNLQYAGQASQNQGIGSLIGNAAALAAFL